jgi:hypothetical protein
MYLRAFVLVIAGTAACTHTVEGTGGPSVSASATDPLPGLSESCDCAGAAEGSSPCCQGDLVCQSQAGALPICSAAGCFLKGVCMSRDEAGR